VGLDDESLRTFQTAGVVDGVLPHTTPNHIMRMVNGKGQVLANVAPGAQDFGWSRRNGFIQPLVDAELLKGLSRFDHVDVNFSHTLLGYVDDADGVTATVELADGSQKTIRARYLIGCDGGKSIIRKSMGVSFEGQSSPTRFLVIDVRNDPLGTPNAYLGADPVRPFVSIGLPHGVRRFEYMIFDHETDEQVADPLFVHQLLARHVPDPAGLDFIRQRVYTLHARIAGAFRKGHVLIAGDAAHLMPVWQGQGYNSGVRDATNLAWKLTAIIRGIADDALLDTYDTERRDHAKAMIDVSVAMGRILSPTNKAVAGSRDKIAAALNLVPAAKKWIAEGRYKPKPRFHVGALVDAIGPAAAGQPVGSMFPQPRVDTRTERNVLLDDVLGPWFSVLVWGNDPRHVFDAQSLNILTRLGVKLVSIRPSTQLHWDAAPTGDPRETASDVTVIGDPTGRLKSWFDTHPVGFVIVRPDRYVAAAALAQHGSSVVSSLATAIHLSSPQFTPGDHHDARARLDVAQPAVGTVGAAG
jgi:3-(3-hydroxy-phenyl)propionate hydroxylase